VNELRWVLLLIGVVIVIAVYFSSRSKRGQGIREHGEADSPTPKLEPGFGPDLQQHAHTLHPFSVPVMAVSAESWNPGALKDTVWLSDIPMPPTIDNGSETVAEMSESLAEDQTAEVPSPTELEVDTQSTPAPEPAQTASELEIEPLVLMLMVMAEEDVTFAGPDISTALEAEGLAHGDMRIFHFRQAAGQEAVFSVASVVEPGYLEPAEPAQRRSTQLQAPGLLLFCQLPGPLPGDEALELMLDKARGLAERLHGYLCDDRRNPLTAQTTAHYHDRIAGFKRELMLRKARRHE
jgi:cell division protein ZipA